METVKTRIFRLVEGRVSVPVRDIPGLYHSAYGESKTLHQVRTHVQMLVDEGLLERPTRGVVADVEAVADCI